MKIALITIHNVSNYGAILQVYATKKILDNYGEVKTIDYKLDYLSHQLDLIRFDFSIRGIKMFVHDILRFPFHYKLIKRFKKIIKSSLNLTESISIKDLYNNKLEKFDVYVCGSDQIWNPVVISEDMKINPIFFLDFAPKNAKKISYASSIGHHHFTEKEKKDVENYLTDFSMISVREKDGKEKLKKILPNRKIYHVVDPTLLLTKKEWLKTFSITLKKPKEKYLLVYSVPRSKLIKEAVVYFADKLNLKIVAIDKMLIPLMKVDKQIRNAGPKEYIELFANASFIITDSFHGTCFSVNFEKPFVAISAGKIQNRIVNLLDQLDINNKILNTKKDFENFNLTIDYNIITPKLEKIRNVSKNFIHKSFTQ